MKSRPSDIEASYDRIARHYAEEYFDELKRKPFDRELLTRFASGVRRGGRVCEVGCGPGQVARFLKELGVDVFGVDLSSGQVECARRLNPDIEFERGDMLALDAGDDSLAGVVSFYAIIHLAREDVAHALSEMRRVLEPGGRLLVSFHCGEGEVTRDEWFGEPVSVFATLFGAREVAGLVVSSGMEVEELAEREPYDFEYPTRRAYLLARKPAVG